MKKLSFLLSTVVALCLISCDAHKYEAEVHGLQTTQVLCTDGKTYSLADCRALEKEPFAAVYFIDGAGVTQGKGYAVYLWDVPAAQFSDSTNVAQSTSSSLEAYDGQTNTFQMYSGKGASSPIAQSIYSLLPHGQQAFIPSVAEMRLLFEAKEMINPIIKSCGGDALGNTWYWTSTEVEGQETTSAWLYSMDSGLYLPTMKTQSHKVRPIVMLRY